MCGIFGYFGRESASMPDTLVAAMGLSIAHRGPDDHGVYTGSALALGNRRLSIIDLEGGHQPIVSDDGQVVLVQNGEIYNYVELAQELAREGILCRTSSDSEVLLQLYLRHGVDFVSRLNGMFAIAIYDRRVDQMILVRDRVGVKPLFVHDDGRRLLFASEIKALLRGGVPRRMNVEALHHLFTYSFVPPPTTMFAGIEHLRPGHLMIIGRESREVRRWWHVCDSVTQERSEDEWIEEFNTVLDDAVRLRMRSDAPYGAFLSGGVDSSTIVGLMARHMDAPVKTFSIGFDDPRFDESVFAQEAAERFRTDHVLETVDTKLLAMWPLTTYHCDQPHSDVSFMPTHRVASLAAEHVKMVLTGDGGDEMFGGYARYLDLFPGGVDPAARTQAEFERACSQSMTLLFSEDNKESVYTDTFRRQVSGLDSWDVMRPLFNETAHMDRINQMLYIDKMILLPGNNLVKPDRMGMAVSLEARTPFLDYRMVELAFRMPGWLKLHGGVGRYLYKKAVQPLIGQNLTYRKKQMFTVPIGEWFRSELSGFVRKVLSADDTAISGFVDRRHIDRMLDQHNSGERNFTREIRAFIAIELWHKIFIEQTECEAFADIGAVMPEGFHA